MCRSLSDYISLSLVRWSARDTFFLEKKKKEDSLSDFLRTRASAGRDTCVFPPFVFFHFEISFLFFGKFRVLILCTKRVA